MIILPSFKGIISKKATLVSKIFTGGIFRTYGGTSQNYVSRLNSDGTLDDNFSIGSGFSGGSPVTCDIQSDGKILIGGNFTSYNGTARNRIVRLNSDGTIDTSFNIGTGFNQIVNKVMIQSDGKIITVGTFSNYNGTGINGIARLNSDGTRDTSLNSGGFSGAVNTFDIQSDSKIVVGGTFGNYAGVSQGRITRLNSDGTRDTNFSIGTGFNVGSAVNAIAIQSDGKILIGGTFTSYNGTARNRIIRLNTDGTIDNSFTIGTGFNNTVNTITIQSDGKIIVGGQFTNYAGTSRNFIARLNSDGTNDATFNIGTGCNAAVNKIIVQSDNKIIIVGSFFTYNGINQNYIIRLNSDGSYDTNFISNTDSDIYVCIAQSDGKIIIVGVFTSYNPSFRFRLAKLEFSGNLDVNTTFGTGFNNDVNIIKPYINNKMIIGGLFTDYNGIVSNRIVMLDSGGAIDSNFNFGTGFNNVVSALAMQSDGKIVIGGGFTNYRGTARNRIVRLNTDGTLDATFSIGTGFNNVVLSMLIQPDGKILIGGNFTSYNGTAINRLIRLNSNGTIDTSFTIGTGFNQIVTALDIQSDGKILVGGLFTNYNGSNYLVRLNSDGTRDTSFSSAQNGGVNAIKIQSDEKILIGGQFTLYQTGIVSTNRISRLNLDGTLDANFNIGTGFNNSVAAIEIQSDGKILIGGAFTTYNGITSSRITRLNSDGTRDTSFDIGPGFNNSISTISII